MVNGSQGYPLMEGQIITYTCPPGFVQAGLSASVCAGNGEWEPDPVEAYCIGDLHNVIIFLMVAIPWLYIMQLTVEYHLWTEMSC